MALAYSAGKGGLAAASEALHGELRGAGVHVVRVYPGPIHTAMRWATAAPSAMGDGLAVRAVPWGTTEVLARRIRAAVTDRSARLIYPRFYWLARWFAGITRFVLDRATPPPAR